MPTHDNQNAWQVGPWLVELCVRRGVARDCAVLALDAATPAQGGTCGLADRVWRAEEGA